MINAGAVQVKLLANTKQYMTAMTAASSQMGAMAGSATKFARTTIFAFAAITAASAKMATDLDKRLREISTLVIGVTEKDIRNMSTEIRELASNTGKAFDDIGKAKYDIISAGFVDLAEAAVLLNSATRLAVGGVTSVTNSADLLTSALNAFGESGFNAEHFADVLFTTVRLGKTTMDELVGSVGRVFPTAKTLGASLEDVGAAMATITAGGIKTYEAATYLNQAFTKLGAPSEKAAYMMNLYGISVKKTDDGMFDLLETIKQFKGYDLQEMRNFFPEIRAIKAVLAMTNNLGFLENAILQTGDAARASQVAFLKMSQAWSTKLNKGVMEFKGQMVELGDDIMPDIIIAFQKFISDTEGGLDGVGDSVEFLVGALGKILTVLVKNIKLITALGVAMLSYKILLKSVTALTIAYNAVVGIGTFLMSSYAFATSASGLALSGMAAAAAMAEMAIWKLDIALASTGIGVVAMVIVAALAAMAIAAMALVKSSRKTKDAMNLLKDSFIGVGLSSDKVTKKMARKLKKDGTLLDVEELGKIATALDNVNKEFWEMATLYPNLQKLAEEMVFKLPTAEDPKLNKNAEFGSGFVAKDFGLVEIGLLLKSLDDYNISLMMAGKNTFAFSREVFDAFNIDLKPIGDFAHALSLGNKELSDYMHADITKLGGQYEALVNLVKRFGLENLSLQGVSDWIDEFYKDMEKVASIDPSPIDEMYKGFKNIQGLSRTTGITFDLPDMEGMLDFNMAPLGKAVSMLYNYKMTWEEISKTKFMTDEEIAKVKEIISILAGQGYDIEDLAKYFGFMKDSLNEVKTLGNLIGDLFKNIGNDIASTMADSFAEMALSGRVAMQELEAYNKGLTNDFRTSAEIQEDAWSNMWNNILLDTARAVIEFGIKMLAMAGMLLIANAISGGMLAPALKVGEIASDAGGFIKFMYNLFGGDNASGMVKGISSVIGDGVITPQGEVIQTSPDDYIMAMKRPGDMTLGKSGGGDVHVVINTVDAKSFEDLMVRNPQAMARGVGNAIGRKNLKLSSKSNTKAIGASF